MRALRFVALSAIAACTGQSGEGAKDSPVKPPPTTEAPPNCEDAIRKAARNVSKIADPEPMSETVAACIKEQWSAETRRCVAAAKDRPDFVACMMRHEEQSGAQNLSIDGVEPDRGDINGDTYVMIKGNRFVADGPRKADVFFGKQSSGYRKGTVVRFASDKQLIVRTPGGRPGEVVDVLVMFEPGGQLRLPNAFTYFEKTSRP
jgi:IPT/TIG domain